MNVSDFDYNLPEELIAQVPSAKRDECRLMVIHMSDGRIEHRRFYDILEYLRPGDCLVLNNSKVIPARLYGVKEGTGAKVEFLLSKRVDPGENICIRSGCETQSSEHSNRSYGEFWETLVRPGRRLKIGDSVVFSGTAPDGTMSHYPDNKLLRATIVGYSDGGTRIVKFEYDGIFMERLEEIGQMPLPPYIARENNSEDKDRYQTVYSKVEGSVAAPTAGLHFTKELLEAAEAKGVKLAYVTLHVGIGTFRPVKAERVEDHHMHFEEYFIDEDAAGIINETKASGGRIISVGTTATRTMESAAVWDREDSHTSAEAVKSDLSDISGIDDKAGMADKSDTDNTVAIPDPADITDSDDEAEGDRNSGGHYIVKAGHDSTGIFIYPGYEFKIVDELITNFHLPKSTLLMLVSALYNREGMINAYNEAVREKYQFFSYGDACLFTE